MHQDTFKILMLIGFLVVLLFFITPPIDNYGYAFLSKKGVFEKDMLYKMLGETRKVLSDYADIKGDEYLHGGITATDKSKCVEVEQAIEHRDANHEHLQDDGHPHREDKKVIDISRLNILLHLGEMIYIKKHIHLTGKEERELLPWFYYAVKLNPENINAYVVGGYWVAMRLNKPDEAIRFLEGGISHNPNSWQIHAQLGEVYFFVKKDYEQALTSLLNSYNLLTDENSDKYDKREVYTFLACSYEELGDIDKTIEFYRKVLILFPESTSVQKRINSLLLETK